MNLDNLLAVHDADDSIDGIMTAVAKSLAIHEHKDSGDCFPSIQALVDSTKFKHSAVKAAIKRLVARGLLVKIKSVKGRYQGSNRYRLVTSAWKAISRKRDEAPDDGFHAPSCGLPVDISKSPDDYGGGARRPRSMYLSSNKNKNNAREENLAVSSEIPQQAVILETAGRRKIPISTVQDIAKSFTDSPGTLSDGYAAFNEHVTHELERMKIQNMALQDGKADTLASYDNTQVRRAI